MVIEIIITLLGLCLTFSTPFVYFHYLLVHVKKKTAFDYHIDLVRDKKGNIGIFIAYITKTLFGAWVTSMGILMSEFFESQLALEIFFITFILYIIFKYFDLNNEK